MQDFGLKLDDPLKLKIVASQEWYLSEGEFQADRVVEQYRSLVDENSDRGFEGPICFRRHHRNVRLSFKKPYTIAKV